MLKKVYNAVAFNVAWLFCVLGGNYVALTTVVAAVSIHLYFISDHKKEWMLLLALPCVGVIAESLFLRTGLLVAPGGAVWAPVWLLCLWVLFATTLNHSLQWFQQHLVLAALVGGAAGALTYLAGTRLTDYELGTPPVVSLLIMFVVWCGLFPAFLTLARIMLPSSTDATQA